MSYILSKLFGLENNLKKSQKVFFFVSSLPSRKASLVSKLLRKMYSTAISLCLNADKREGDTAEGGRQSPRDRRDVGGSPDA